jgi:hypothetical protein
LSPPFSSKPILDGESSDAFELAGIGGHDRGPDRSGAGSDQHVVQVGNDVRVQRVPDFAGGSIRTTRFDGLDFPLTVGETHSTIAFAGTVHGG